MTLSSQSGASGICQPWPNHREGAGWERVAHLSCWHSPLFLCTPISTLPPSPTAGGKIGFSKGVGVQVTDYHLPKN